MAKMKTFAVEVEITERRIVYVDARRPNGAIERLKTREGWARAVQYSDDELLYSIHAVDDKRVKVINTREAAF